MEMLSSMAWLSNDGKYRYLLSRKWSDRLAIRRIMWIMLNPSTADALKDDPTIRRCIQFSRDWGFDEMRVCNLYAYRATKPKDLPSSWPERFGPENGVFLWNTSHACATIVCAWGVNGKRLTAPVDLDPTKKLWCLGKTKGGYPKHPLYVPANTKLEALWWPTY